MYYSKIAEETWSYIERLLTEECGLPPDCGIKTERPNCVNAIKNALEARDDFRWLIEAPGQRYLAARKLGNHEFYWVQDHNAAIAFRDEAQADMTMMAIRDLAPALFNFERTIGNAKAVEHAWMGGLERYQQRLGEMLQGAAARINAAR